MRSVARSSSSLPAASGAAIWSSQPKKFFEFPARFLVAFLRNHGLLQLRGRPVWKTIPGGAKRYVEALIDPILVETREQMSAVFDRVRPEWDAVVDSARSRIESVLSPDQVERYRALLEEQEREDSD